MMNCKRLIATGFALALVGTAATVNAAAVDILVGDKDGFGIGCSDTGTCAAALGSPVIDNRSAGEAAATDGAQFTDLYSALFPGFGPNPASGDVQFSFTGTLLSATISFALGDFQCDVFGAISANVNGVAEPFCFSDGRFATAIHSISLSAAELAAANLTGTVTLHLDHTGSNDFISFDWFQLTGEAVTVPEPASLALLGLGLAGLGFARRRT